MKALYAHVSACTFSEEYSKSCKTTASFLTGSCSSELPPQNQLLKSESRLKVKIELCRIWCLKASLWFWSVSLLGGVHLNYKGAFENPHLSVMSILFIDYCMIAVWNCQWFSSPVYLLLVFVSAEGAELLRKAGYSVLKLFRLWK